MERDEFNRLVKIWHRDTDAMSNVHMIIDHWAYKEILSAAPIKFIMEDLRDEGGHWFIALSQLTGANPIRKGNGTLMDHPTTEECVNSWVKWGKDNGYL